MPSLGKLKSHLNVAGPQVTEFSPAPEKDDNTSPSGDSFCSQPCSLPLNSDLLRTADIFTSAVSAEPIFRCKVRVGSHEATAVLDSGADRSLIGSHLVEKRNITPCSQAVHAVGKHVLYPVGKTTVRVKVHGVDIKLVDCFVLDHLGPPVDLLIGRDSMELHGLSLDMESRSISGQRSDKSRWTVYLPIPSQDSCVHFAAAVPCFSAEDLRINPGSVAELRCSLGQLSSCDTCQDGRRQLIFSGDEVTSPDLDFVAGILDRDHPRVLVNNRGHAALTIRKGTTVGYADSAADSTLDFDQPTTDVYVSTSAGKRTVPAASEIQGLTEEQQAAVKDLFERHAAVFMQSATDTLQSSMTAHRIVLTDDTPIFIRPRKFSPPVAEEVEKQCLDLERLGIIERCESAWSAPVVPVRKKDGTLRLCVDY